MAEKKTTKKAAAPKAEEPKKATVKKAAALRLLRSAKRKLCWVWAGSSRRVSWLLLTRRLLWLNLEYLRTIERGWCAIRRTGLFLRED